MKHELPASHGLTKAMLQHLVFREGNEPSLTDVQHEALDAGVARGESMLVVSPRAQSRIGSLLVK